MTCGHRTALLAVSVLSCSILQSALSAQQPAPGGQQAPAPAKRSESRWVAQGFSVVLVLADLQASTAPDDVPPAARRALADMKDFLPFKHYRVLDSQWTSCCAQASLATLSGRLQGVAGHMSGSELKLVQRPYAFNLTIQPGGDKLQVQFGLREEDGGPGQEAASERQLQILVEDYQIARQRLEEEKKRVAVGVLSPRDLRPLEDEVLRLERNIAAARADAPSPRGSKGVRNVINSSFTMDVGETVVVGTSRLGGDKALIALVTAAKRSGTTAREESPEDR